jgi:SAM-dependent methyltransferase
MDFPAAKSSALNLPSSLREGSAISEGICAACDAPEFDALFSVRDRLCRTTSREFSMVACRICGVVRLHPQPVPEELGIWYPNEYWTEPTSGSAPWVERFFHRIMRQEHLRFIERSLAECEEPGLVLDVACRAGFLLAAVARRGRENVVGLDFSLGSATAAWRRNRVPAVCSTLSRAPFLPGSCALITMFHVLEHLYDPSGYLEAAHNLLAPDGRLILQVGNVSSWQFLLLGERWSGLNVPRHLIQFRRCDVEALLTHCGFEILREKHFSLRDNPASYATSLAPGLNPSVRRLRGTVETQRMGFWKNLAYFALTAVCIPIALLEATCRAGSTVIYEARKKS